MNNSIYQKYREQKFPHNFQKRVEGFASMSNTVQEEMFRAGFYCGLHINNVFPDPDRPVLDNGYILVRKKECEERIAELESQIEKMKCCGNCENRYGQEKCKDCHNYSKWKFKQAEQFYEEIVE